MRKLFGHTTITSDKNGKIEVHYFFGRPYVFVDGYHESTHYTGTMWWHALRHLPVSFEASRILMLGLGGGSAVRSLLRKFKNCELVIVEWDPAMIELYKEVYGEIAHVTIMEGDATILVPAMREKFDLVLVDLFTGSVTPPALSGDEMVQAIANVLSPNSYCLLNAFKSLDLPEVFDRHFAQIELWHYKFNTLLLYENHQRV